MTVRYGAPEAFALRSHKIRSFQVTAMGNHRKDVFILIIPAERRGKISVRKGGIKKRYTFSQDDVKTLFRLETGQTETAGTDFHRIVVLGDRVTSDIFKS